MNWLISANSNIYDHSSSFKHYGYIDWTQKSANVKIGDIVYIYCTRPIKMVQYKCKIIKTDLQFDEIRDDEEYWIDKSKYNKSKDDFFMRLVLIEQVSNDMLSLNMLMKNGLKSAPQSSMRILNQHLLEYLERHFTDDFQNDFFPEVIDMESIDNEGLKKTIYVNKYERSHKAREEAIKYHGTRCCVCGIDFSEMYGEIGKGFIHIHHLVPICSIGKEYKINYKTDLVPVCPNCHSMLHRRINGNYPTVDVLKKMIIKQHK